MARLSDRQEMALRQWYSQPQVLDKALAYLDDGNWSGMEEYLHRDALMPIARIDELPEFMLDEKGTPFFPTGIDPSANLEVWQDAIEVGWEVMERERGISHDRVHQEIAKIEQDDWDSFIRRAEERKKSDGT
jgi:hypothetical protein